nr:succinate dehydrogenase subunit 2 [Rufusia pilicola]
MTNLSIAILQTSTSTSTMCLSRCSLVSCSAQPLTQCHRPVPVLTRLLDARHADPGITLRFSCREGICGSCAIAANGTPILACTSAGWESPTLLQPVPHLAVIRDLVVDTTMLLTAFEASQPWRRSSDPRMSITHRLAIEQHFECILCGCCNGSCPSLWWTGPGFLGPAVLLQSLRWALGSKPADCGAGMLFSMSLHGCHGIGSCSGVCPKGLSPSNAMSVLRAGTCALRTSSWSGAGNIWYSENGDDENHSIINRTAIRECRSLYAGNRISHLPRQHCMST